MWGKIRGGQAWRLGNISITFLSGILDRLEACGGASLGSFAYGVTF